MSAATYGVVEDASARGSEERLLAVVGLFLVGLAQLLVAHRTWDDGKCRCVLIHVRQVCTPRDGL